MKERPILFSAPMIRKLLDEPRPKTQTRRIVNLDRLRVRLDRPVRNEWFEGMPRDIRLEAPPGIHRAHTNQHGAISIDVKGQSFGLKPDEFHFECPYADGDTHLGVYGAGRKLWTIVARASRLWVKETFRAISWTEDDQATIEYRADSATIAGDIGDEDPLAWIEREAARMEALGATEEDGLLRLPEGVAIPWRPSIFMPRWASRISLDVASVRIERLHEISEADAMAEGFENVAAFRALWCELNGAESWEANPFVWVVSFTRAKQ